MGGKLAQVSGDVKPALSESRPRCRSRAAGGQTGGGRTGAAADRSAIWWFYQRPSSN